MKKNSGKFFGEITLRCEWGHFVGVFFFFNQNRAWERKAAHAGSNIKSLFYHGALRGADTGHSGDGEWKHGGADTGHSGDGQRKDGKADTGGSADGEW